MSPQRIIKKKLDNFSQFSDEKVDKVSEMNQKFQKIQEKYNLIIQQSRD